jgi:IS5 family transposase
MFRATDPQLPLLDPTGLARETRERIERSWAEAFRLKALPILRGIEPEFADLFHKDDGRPNRPVEVVVGTLILKEMGDLTDDEVLDQLEFDTRFWWAFQRPGKELHLCQKTLHNFRQRLIAHEKTKLAFRRVTDELIRALNVDTKKQRLDSTHIVSNIEYRTRLGLICETIRVFLRALETEVPEAHAKVPAAMIQRHAEKTRYFDAKPAEGKKRLPIVARDLYRLVKLFENDKAVTKLEAWSLVNRLFGEQCRILEKEVAPREDDDDHGEGGAPVELKPGPQVPTDGLVSPHDPDATYSGHKKKSGYETQVAETCAEQGPRLITNVEVTPAAGSDTNQTVPMVNAMIEAGQAPTEVYADTAYGGGANAAALSEKGVRLMAPVPGPASARLPAQKDEPLPATPCPTDDAKKATQWARRQEATGEFRKRYAIRAGIEATNSELKNVHGLGHLRVRGGVRVRLAVYFKALACNVKRALRHWLVVLTAAPVQAAPRAVRAEYAATSR